MDVEELVAAAAESSSSSGGGVLPLAASLSAGETENIAVCIRVRPLNEREVRSRDCNVLRTLDALNVISVTDAAGAPLGGKHNVFQYDHIFDETRATRYMYRRVAQRIVRSTLEGINGTIFAYGQTSSGKTYTMQGNVDGATNAAALETADAGVLQLAVQDIFAYIESCDDRDFLLRVSFVEIYNEVVRDLLATGDRGSNLKVREDPRKGVYVECQEEIITSHEDILRLLAQGNERRAVGQTAMNERSSRSHSIFRIVIESKQRSGSRRHSEDDMSGAVLVACLSLVDLAGSESVRHTAAEGIRQREAGNINKSLLTLSRVINSLASSSPATQSAPFRDSKLTRLLQNSLDGNTRTLIICCVTPSDRYLDETKSTLQFAARAKTIQTSASVNEVLDDQAQLKRLKREVHELKKLVNSDAFSQLKAENEALMHEKRRHKDEYARLMGLILTSATRAQQPASDSKLKQRGKRTRETWCPGDFPSQPLRGLENVREVPPSPNPQPRKRRTDSDAKENVVPQNLLSAMEAEMDGDDDVDERELGEGGAQDRMHVLTAKLLGVLELALQNYRDDCDDNYQALNDAIEQVHELIAWEEDQERLSELLQDLKSLVDLSANSEHLRGENELLNMEVEELHRKLGLLSDSSAPSSQEESSSTATSSLEALRMQLTESQQALAKERELVAELSREKQIAEQMAAEESKVHEEQLEALRAEFEASQAAAHSEKQELESALAKANAEMAQLKKNHEAQSEQLASERAGLTDAMAALEEQLQQTAKYHSDLEARVKFLVEEKSALTEKVEVLESELAHSSEDKKSQADSSSEQEEESNESEASLSNGLQTLLQDMSKLQFDLETATTENQTLAAERDAIKQELEEIRAQQLGVDDERQTVASVQSELESLKQSSGEELERLRMELEFAANEKQASAVNIQDLNEERAQLAEALRSIKAEMDQLLGENVQKAYQLEIQVSTLRAEKDARENKVAALQAKLEAAGEEMARLKMKLVELDEERHSLLATVSSLEANLQELESERTGYASQAAGLEERVGALSLENNQLKEANHAYSLEKLTWLQKSASSEDLENEIGTMHEEQTRLSLLVEELETRLASKLDVGEEHESQISKLSAEIAAYETTVAEQATAIEQLRAELTLSDREHAALLARIEQLSRFEEKVAELESEIAQSSDQQADGDGSKVYGLEAAKIQAEERASALEAEKAELADQLRLLRDVASAESSESNAGEQSELRHRIAALEHENEKVNAELETVAGQRSELFEELSALESQLMDESREKLRLQAAVDALEKQLRESGATSELASELERARQAESVLMNELENLSAAMEKLEGENKSLQSRASSRRTSDEGGGDDVEALRQRLEIEGELRATLELDVKSYEDTLEVLRSELKDSSESIADLLEKMKDMEAEMDALRQAKEKAEREVEIARELAQRAKEEQDELRFQNQQHALSFEQRDNSSVEALGKLAQELQDAKQTIQSQQEALEARPREASNESTTSMLEKTIDDLQDQLLESRKALAMQSDEWKMKQDDAEQQIARLTGDLEKRETEIARLSEEIATARHTCAELQTHREALEQQLVDVDSQWRAKESELSQQVAAELSNAKQAYNDVVAQKEALTAELRENDSKWRAKEQALSQQVATEMDSLREQYQEAQEELDSYQKYADDEIHKLRAAVEASDVEVEIAKTREQELSSKLQEQEQWVAHVKTKHEALERECSELLSERKGLEEKLASLLSTRDDAVEHLENELREVSLKCEQTEAKLAEAAELTKDLKAAMEQLEGAAYKHRNELEDMAEALKSAQMEATHYHDQLIEEQRGKEELETLVETQRKRIDKLEKVKMTTETLELFRKLKKDRADLQARVQALQHELGEAEKASTQSKENARQQTTRLIERKEEELTVLREHIDELEQAVQRERECAASMRSELTAAVRDAKEKAQEVIKNVEDKLRERAAHVEALEQEVQALAKDKAEILAQKSGNVTYLEKENLELLVENRQLKKRLESSSSSRPGDCSVSSRMLADAPDIDPSAAAASAILAESKAPSSSVELRDSLLSTNSAGESKSSSDERPSSGFLISSKHSGAKDEEDEEARPACAQQ